MKLIKKVNMLIIKFPNKKHIGYELPKENITYTIHKSPLFSNKQLENLKELLRAMQDYANLENFLEHVALATSVDQEWEVDRLLSRATG